MIVANVRHTLINCTCNNRLGFSLLPFTLIPQYLEGSNWSISLTFSLFSLASMISRSFHTVRRVREAWKWEVGKHMFRLSLFLPSRRSNPSPPRFHVGRRKIQISPPPGEQDWSNALPQGQQRQCNPHPTPCLPPPPPPRRLYIDRCIERIMKGFTCAENHQNEATLINEY